MYRKALSEFPNFVEQFIKPFRDVENISPTIPVSVVALMFLQVRLSINAKPILHYIWLQIRSEHLSNYFAAACNMRNISVIVIISACSSMQITYHPIFGELVELFRPEEGKVLDA